MKTSKKILALFLITALVVGLFGCGTTETAETTESGNAEATVTEDTIVFKLSDSSSDGTAMNLAMHAIADEVEAQTEGRIIIEIYPSSQLGDIKASMESVQMNTLDMAITNQATCGAIVPEFAILGSPFTFESDEHAIAAINGELGDYLNEQMAAKNMTIVSHVCSGFRNVFSSTPIQSVDDFDGLKIRTMENTIDMDTFNELGAIATPMAYGELFTALQQKTVDAAENLISNVLGEKFYEACPYVTETEHFYNFVQVIMSDAAIEKIPEDLKETFFEACKEGAMKGSQIVIDENARAKEELETLGVEFYTIDKAVLQQLVEPVFDKNADKLPGELVQKADEAL